MALISVSLASLQPDTMQFTLPGHGYGRNEVQKSSRNRVPVFDTPYRWVIGSTQVDTTPSVAVRADTC